MLRVVSVFAMFVLLGASDLLQTESPKDGEYSSSLTEEGSMSVLPLPVMCEALVGVKHARKSWFRLHSK